MANPFWCLVCRGMDDLEDLQYDWDGRGGLPTRPDSYVYVESRLKAWAKPPATMPDPAVFITTSGGVRIEVERDGRRLVLTIPCENVIVYRRVYPGGATTDGVIRDNGGILGPGGGDPAFVEPLLAELYWASCGD